MSVEMFSGQVYSQITPQGLVAAMREIVGILVAHTPASLCRVDQDDADGFNAVVFVGGDRYARLSAVYNGSTTSIDLSAGYMDGDTYVPISSTSRTGNAIYNTVFANSVVTINGGDMWDLIYYCSGSPDTMRLRATKLISSLDGQTTWACASYSQGAGSYRAFPDSSCDFVLIDGAGYGVTYPTSDFARYSVPSDKLLLFPSNLRVAANNTLGAPTIGGQRTYLMSGEETIPLPAYTEFRINAWRYVSLGHVAIRST